MAGSFKASQLVLLLVAAARSLPTLEVGFCDSQGNGFFREQPSDQLERGDGVPFDNGTHLVINWRNDRRVSGRNVSRYHVDVKTTVPVLNLFVGQFGGFPQDVCAPGGSKARNAVNVEGSAGTCAPYAKGSHTEPRHTAFEIPVAMRLMTSWDIIVTVRGYGAYHDIGRPGEETPCTWWCHKYALPKHVPALSASPPPTPTPPPGLRPARTEPHGPHAWLTAHALRQLAQRSRATMAAAWARIRSARGGPVTLCYGRVC